MRSTMFRGYRVQLDVAHGHFWRRHIDTIDGDVAQARLGAANLYIFALPFIPLERNAGQAANRICNICVRQASI